MPYGDVTVEGNILWNIQHNIYTIQYNIQYKAVYCKLRIQGWRSVSVFWTIVNSVELHNLAKHFTLFYKWFKVSGNKSLVIYINICASDFNKQFFCRFSRNYNNKVDRILQLPAIMGAEDCSGGGWKISCRQGWRYWNWRILRLVWKQV